MSGRPVQVVRKLSDYPPGTPQPTPCVLWQGSAHSAGYGRYFKADEAFYIHRWIWAHFNGPIPPGMVVMHMCDNPPCYRLDHLVLGTHADNVADKVTKGRGGRGNRPRRDTCRRWGHPIRQASNGHRWCETCAKLGWPK